MLVEANGANGATVREYVWFDDMPLAIVANVDTASPQLLHVHADHLDRPIMLTNGSKTNVWAAVYRPFGQVNATTGSRKPDVPNFRNGPMERPLGGVSFAPLKRTSVSG